MKNKILLSKDGEKIGRWIREGFEKSLEDGASNPLLISIAFENIKDFTSPPSKFLEFLYQE